MPLGENQKFFLNSCKFLDVPENELSLKLVFDLNIDSTRDQLGNR